MVVAGNYPDAEQFQTDLRLVFDFCQYADDKEKLLTFVKKNREGLSNLSEDAYDLISAVTNTKEHNKIKEEKQKEYEAKSFIYSREIFRKVEFRGDSRLSFALVKTDSLCYYKIIFYPDFRIPTAIRPENST